MKRNMTQKKVVLNKVEENKELKLSKWDITKYGNEFIVSSSDVFIHGTNLIISHQNLTNTWLSVFQDNIYIACIWIATSKEIKKKKKFLGVD